MSDLSLEDELKIPAEATLVSTQRQWSLQTSSTSVAVAVETAIRPNARCIVVGRQAKAADLRIQHGSISRKHAALYFLGSQLILEDFGSKKGTTVNGSLVQGITCKLKVGDEIVFGHVRESVFQVHCSEGDSNSSPDKKASTEEEATEETTLVEEDDEEPQPAKPVPEPGAGLTGRAKREAEIAAMMNSLEQNPSYSKYVLSAEEMAPRSKTNKKSNNSGKTSGQSQPSISADSVDTAALDQITKTAQQHKLPILERITMETDSERRHMVTCIGLDPSGVRFVVGTTDNLLRVYDFGGMDQIRKDPFKMVQADEGHVVSDVCYSNTGDRVIVGTGSLQPFVLDRDGAEIIKFVRGDMYVTDQTHTIGHTAAVTGVAWHPLERDIVLTVSNDGSARLWKLSGKTQFSMLVCDKVFQPKNEKGKRTGVTCVAYHPGGREFVVGTSCGSIQIWNTARVSGRPERAIYDAHGGREPVNSIVYSVDGSRIASRSAGDSNCKVWDPRRLSRSASPLAVCTGAPTLYEHCKAAFSPDGTVLCAGTSRQVKTADGKRSEIGGVNFYHIPKSTAQLKQPIDAILGLDVTFSAGVTVVRWHPKLNQIFLGCSDGKTEILFDPKFSRKGALLPFGKAGRKADGLTELLKSRLPTGSAGVRGTIIAPNAIPIGQGNKRKRDKDEVDPAKLRQPEAPGAGFKTGGTQAGAGLSFIQHVADNRLGAVKEIAGKDPRAELLKYREGKNFIGDAYKGNIEIILAEKTVEQEEAEQEGK